MKKLIPRGQVVAVTNEEDETNIVIIVKTISAEIAISYCDSNLNSRNIPIFCSKKGFKAGSKFSFYQSKNFLFDRNFSS